MTIEEMEQTNWLNDEAAYYEAFDAWEAQYDATNTLLDDILAQASRVKDLIDARNDGVRIGREYGIVEGRAARQALIDDLKTESDRHVAHISDLQTELDAVKAAPRMFDIGSNNCFAGEALCLTLTQAASVQPKLISEWAERTHVFVKTMNDLGRVVVLNHNQDDDSLFLSSIEQIVEA